MPKLSDTQAVLLAAAAARADLSVLPLPAAKLNGAALEPNPQGAGRPGLGSPGEGSGLSSAIRTIPS